MWTFGDNDNKNTDGGYENGGDSRRDDVYSSYTDKTPNNAGSGSGKRNPAPKKNLGIVILLCVAVLAVTLFAGTRLGMGKNSGTSTTLAPNSTTDGALDSTDDSTTAVTAPSVTGAVSGADKGSVESIAQKCLESSVLITTSAGAGSGVFYSADGYILTNYHVVGTDATNITVTLFSGEKYPAVYVYGDESLDITVIKIEKENCPAAELCTDPVNYGAQVIVIGNALGDGFTLTSGYVSAPEREVTISYETMKLIQIDAAVNSGNSGGGLFNTAGQLIGLVNAKSSGTTSSGATIDNVGFAIPVSTILRCVNDLRDYGYVTGVARLGIEATSYFEYPAGYMVNGYITVSKTVPNGSAALSGIKEGDIIYAIGDTQIDSFATLKKLLTAYSVGDKVKFTVLRPTEASLSSRNALEYLRSCELIEITVKFVEFNPNA